MGRPRKVYKTVSNSDEESADSEETDSEEMSTEEEAELLECNLSMTSDPTTWDEAKHGDDVESWRIAMEDEYLAQIRNNTWEITSRPTARKVAVDS